MKKFVVFILMSVVSSHSFAQGYNATNGSPYAGALGNFINPASAINYAAKWDLSVIGAQSNTSNSGVSITNLTLNNAMSNPSKIIVQPTSGYGSRSIDNAADLNLLNFRHNIDNIQSISYGIRIREVTHMAASPFKYSDTTSDLYPFLNYNVNSTPFNAQFYNSDWLENDFSYSRVLSEDDENRFTGGVTLALCRGIFNSSFSLDSIKYKTVNNQNLLTGGSASFIYSSNPYTLNPFAFGKGTKIHLGLSFGFEYIAKQNFFEEPYTPKDYYWKLSASIMDIGSLGFTSNNSSYHLNTPVPSVTTITDVGLRNYIAGTSDPTNLKKKLVSYFKGSQKVKSTYTVSLPTRLVVNFDKSISENFYVNVLASVNFYSRNATDIYKIKTTQLDRLIITPRLENDVWGIYAPIQYTMKNDMLVGLALKLGPVLIGVHNISWLQRTKIEELNGGGYFALHFQPHLKRLHHSLDCYSEY